MRRRLISGFIPPAAASCRSQPKTAADAGVNATLGSFSSQYPGLTLTTNSVGLPSKTVYKNGEACPSGTPDAGKTVS